MNLSDVKNVDTAKMFVRTKWFEFKKSNIRFFVYGFVTGVIGWLILGALATNMNVIHESLIEIDRGGRVQYFTSISAAILGVLAITFSLAVFALQHAAENGSARILETFGNSRRVVFDYVLIASIAILIYIFGLTAQTSGYFTSISLLLSLLLIVLVLWRVFAFYQSIVSFINPLEQIRSLSKDAKKFLSNARELLLRIKKNEAVPEPSASKLDPEDLFVTANFDHQDIYRPFQGLVTALTDRMRVYANKQRHEVTGLGYKELTDIVNLYFSVRKYSTASVGLFVEDGRTDQYLMLVLEQLKGLHAQALQLEDQDGLQQNFLCHANIAVGATSYKFLGTDVANANLNFIIGYLHRNLLDAMRKNVDDAVMNGIRYLSAITPHIPTEHYLSMSQLADSLKEQALATITVQKWYITQEAVNGLVAIVVWSLQESFASEQILKPTLKNLSEVAIYYVNGGMNVSINGGALSSAIASVNQKSIPYIVNEYIVQYWEKHGDFDESIFEEFAEYYENLGKIAAESGSFLMHFVLSALNLHLEQLIRLRWHKDQQKQEAFLNGIKQILTTYSRIYSFLPENYERKSFGYLEFEKLKTSALWALKERDAELFSELINAFKSFYRQAREKTTDEFTALRIYADIVELGAIASVSEMSEIADQIVEMAPKVQEQQLKLHATDDVPESYREKLVERLSKEIWDIYDDYRQYHPMRHDEIRMENMISIDALMTYLNRIEMAVYKRKTTKRYRRMF